MKKILIVDDEFIVRMGIKSILNWEEYGYTVVGEAEDGAQALKLIVASHPDIVLTDLMMENMDGFELMHECRKRWPQMKFIVLSSYNDFENVKRAMKLGASDYIFKMTAKPEELLKVINEVSGSIEVQNDAESSLILKNKQAIKKNIFYKCIFQNQMVTQEMKSEFSVLQLDIDFSKPYILLYFIIKLSDLDDQILLKKDDHISTLHFSMINIADEVLKNQWRADSFPLNHNTIVSVINLPEDTDWDVDLLEEKFSLIQEYYKRYLRLSVYGIVSTIGQGLSDLSQLHHKCMEMRTIHRNEAGLNHCEITQRPEILKAKEYILHHLSSPLSVAEVAKIACISENYFSSIFKKEMGISFVDYVNLARVQKAAELLKNNHYKIYEICQEVGIQNPNYFSILFKKIMGISPNAYRNE